MLNKTNPRNRSWLLIAPTALWLVATASLSQTEPPPSPKTGAIAQRYLTTIGTRDLDAQPFADGAVMRDVTADFFSMDDLVAGVRGRPAIVAMQKSWKLKKIDFDIAAEFVVGEFAAFSGAASITHAEGESQAMNFLTVLRVEGDAVTERHDYWDYAGVFPTNKEQQANAATTREVADAYLQAYLEQRFDDARALMADGIDFQDPTAAYFGPRGGAAIVGAEALTERRREIFAGILSFDLDVESSFVTNHHAVYIGRTRFSIAGSGFQSDKESIGFDHAAAFVIGVADGKVTYHRDFVDYSDFREQAQAQLEQG